VTDCLVGPGATLELDVVQNENARAFHVGALHVEQQSESTFRSTSIALGGAIVRNTVWTRFDGERSECTLNGLTLGNGNQLIDNHTAIDHASANCTSHELYKAILDGSARGVFNGKIYVRKDAQKTDAKQTNRTLLLSDAATMDTKPQLEIVADDVKCTHGATIGQLEDEQVFYLRSRGIDLESARDILTFAFGGDIIARMQVPPVREALERMLRARLRAGRITDNG
jgi:Fe-S cluster assembly protein SufD